MFETTTLLKQTPDWIDALYARFRALLLRHLGLAANEGRRAPGPDLEDAVLDI
jgi:hypothetical protein